jgi:uncharacterized protein YggE
VAPQVEFARAGGGEATTPVQPGQVQVQANVTIRYAVGGPRGGADTDVQPRTE